MNLTFSCYFADKPVMAKNPMLSKSASDLGETAKLTCESRAVPNVTFAWKRPGSSASGVLENSTKFEVVNVAIDLLNYRSELRIKNVTHKDYGTYECIARNSEGISRTRVILDVKSRPDPPSDLHVVNVTHNSVHLAWNPGFHGGMDQYFRIKYSKAGSYRTLTHDVYPANIQDEILTGLEPGVQYSLHIMAFNNIGESNYTEGPPVIVRTSGKKPCHLDSIITV